MAAHPPRRRRRRRRHPLGGVRAGPLRSGLIIVDEEHDGSYKQEESPRYHGRDVAIVRGRQAGALVVLGSATPSLESFHNAQNGRYDLIALERRVLDRPMAAVRIVDMREEYAASGPDVILSGPLCEALDDRLARREQSIVLLNRRGFATSVFCRQCASTLECPNCSVSLTVHRAARRRARCHYCNYAMALPKACANCAGPFLEQIGFGTERVEAEIVAKFPGVRVARVDRDTIRKRGAIVALLSRFAAGEIDVLVGTQMIAKGHDFPRVTLVGVISADVGLGLADFRAAERTFQLLTQVAGRAGRGEIPGEAIVQTLYPEALQHPACVPPGLRGVLRGRDRVPPRHAISAGRRAHQRRRQGAQRAKRPWRTRGSSCTALQRSAASRIACSVRRRRRSAGSRGAPRAVLHQGDPPPDDAAGAAAGARAPAGDSAHGRLWMSIRCRCCEQERGMSRRRSEDENEGLGRRTKNVERRRTTVPRSSRAARSVRA